MPLVSHWALPTAPDVVIVPVGMAFESKVETRSRAVVMFGEPITVAEFAGIGLGADGEPDRSDAEALTARITDALEGLAALREPRRTRDAALLCEEERSAATGDVEASFGDAEVVACSICSDGARRTRTGDACVPRLRDSLQLLGVTARELRPQRVSIARLVLSAVVLFLAGSLVVPATLIHLPAVLIVVVGTGLVR